MLAEIGLNGTLMNRLELSGHFRTGLAYYKAKGV